MSDPAERHREVFREEAYELLSELEGSLLELEKDPENEDLVGRIFRAMHTIKGSGAMFGFTSIVSFTHDLETIFDHVRNKKMQVTTELVGLTLDARDILREMLDSPEGAPTGKEAGEITARLRGLLPDALRSWTEDGHVGGRQDTAAPSGDAGKPATYRIRFRPGRDIFRNGTNPSFLLNELRALGDCISIAQIDSVPALDEADPEACYFYWDLILTTSRGLNAIRDVFIFVEDTSGINIELIDEGDLQKTDGYKRIGEILLEKGDITSEELKKALSLQRHLGDLLVENGVVPPGKVLSALEEQKHVREKRKCIKEAEAASSIRVPSGRLDKLADLIGELVTMQARLSRLAMGIRSPELTAIAEGVEHLSEELRDTIMNIRLVPIELSFSKLKRVVRDLSGELGKEVELEIEGAETELDKSLIEKLGDPLVHIVRNSIDHGIELPGERESMGKPRKGTIRLSAAHSGANVTIRVTDDGKGLDLDAIREKAMEKGLIPHGAEIADRDIFQLIFASGLSTSGEVTKVSGRGVGMDVVKKNIESLRGTVEIESRKGRGTDITLKLPLTLAIIDGLLVKIGDSHFVIPLSMVEECVELERGAASAENGKRIANVRGEIVPYIDMRDIFGIEGTPPKIEQIVITQADGKKAGFLVDQVIGENQTVIKALGSTFKKIDWISGATILGDGSVALIIAAQQLIKWMEQQEIDIPRKAEG
ncbi:MAG: chemotaxis protein CheA [Nitrospiraceae bacterium]|nr:chemotaxis protein CheA [Nitrospiraceae bacterium]